MPVNMPATVNAGDTLLMLVRANNISSLTPVSGWTTLFNLTPSESSPINDDTMYLAYKKAAGTEGGTTVNVSFNTTAKAAAIVWRITGAADPTVNPPELSTQAIAATTTPNPTAVTPSGGAKDYLFLWIGGWDGEQTSPPASQPTGYSNPTGISSGTAGATATNCQVAGASKQGSAATTEDPGSWTITVAPTAWSAWAVAIYPAPLPVQQPFTVKAQFWNWL